MIPKNTVNSIEPHAIREAVEQAPFADPSARAFFQEWCRIHDSIVPQFISRTDWERRGMRKILEKNNRGEQTLFLPEDLRLWEIIDVVKMIDHDTFARKPEKREDGANKIKALGETFEKAGIYLSKYLPALEDSPAKTIADDLAREFYQYGLSLHHKKRQTDQIPESADLSPEDKAKLDAWFLGGEAHQKRLARLGENPTQEAMENMRKKLFSVYFKALERDGYKAAGEKPWQTKSGPIQALQDQAKRQLVRAVETPKREMTAALFRRGVERLVTEMKAERGIKKYLFKILNKVPGANRLFEQKTLYETLQIDALKQDLKTVRQTGDLRAISAKELEIAQKIQKAVSSFRYRKNAHNPSTIIETQALNCVGASTLGGGLLDELEIRYLHAHVPKHSATVLITSDGKIYWQDFTPGKLPSNYTEIRPDMTTQDVNVSPLPKNGTVLHLKAWNPYPYNIDRKLEIPLSLPAVGLESLLLTNTGNIFGALGKHQEAIQAFQRAIQICPQDAHPYYGLGNALHALDRDKEAVEAHKKFIELWNGEESWLKITKKMVRSLHDADLKETF